MLEEKINAEGFESVPGYFQKRFDDALAFPPSDVNEAVPINRETPVTMVPIYSENGDVTATVQVYTGINRNTKHPEEAFFVVDYLMSAQAQQELKTARRGSLSMKPFCRRNTRSRMEQSILPMKTLRRSAICGIRFQRCILKTI